MLQSQHVGQFLHVWQRLAQITTCRKPLAAADVVVQLMCQLELFTGHTVIHQDFKMSKNICIALMGFDLALMVGAGEWVESLAA